MVVEGAEDTEVGMRRRNKLKRLASNFSNSLGGQSTSIWWSSRLVYGWSDWCRWGHIESTECNRQCRRRCMYLGPWKAMLNTLYSKRTLAPLLNSFSTTSTAALVLPQSYQLPHQLPPCPQIHFFGLFLYLSVSISRDRLSAHIWYKHIDTKGYLDYTFRTLSLARTIFLSHNFFLSVKATLKIRLS